MPVSYSKDLRERVIRAWKAKEGSQRQLAQRFKVSLSFVRNLLSQYRTNGQIEAKRRGGYQKPTIQNEHLGFIQSLVEEKNDLLLRELCVGVARRRHRYAERTGISVSISTMHRAVEKLGLRVKKKSLCQRARYPKSTRVKREQRDFVRLGEKGAIAKICISYEVILFTIKIRNCPKTHLDEISQKDC